MNINRQCFAPKTAQRVLAGTYSRFKSPGLKFLNQISGLRAWGPTFLSLSEIIYHLLMVTSHRIAGCIALLHWNPQNFSAPSPYIEVAWHGSKFQDHLLLGSKTLWARAVWFVLLFSCLTAKPKAWRPRRARRKHLRSLEQWTVLLWYRWPM